MDNADKGATNRMLVILIIPVMLTVVMCKVKRNKSDVYFVRLASDINSSLALFSLFCAILIVFLRAIGSVDTIGEAIVGFIFFIVWALMLFGIIDLLSINYKFEKNGLSVKEGLLKRRKHIDITTIKIIQLIGASIDGLGPLEYRVDMTDGTSFYIHRKTENVGNLFSRLAKINDNIRFYFFSYDDLEEKFYRKFFSWDSIIAIVFYTLGLVALATVLLAIRA